VRERCDFHRSTIAIGNAFIDYTLFIPRIRMRIAVAAHAHRSRNWKLSLRLIAFLIDLKSSKNDRQGTLLTASDVISRCFSVDFCRSSIATLYIFSRSNVILQFSFVSKFPGSVLVKWIFQNISTFYFFLNLNRHNLACNSARMT
jgi:hypothetical protein